MIGSCKSVTVVCMKGFQGEICCSVETKEDISSYQLFVILSLFWVSLEHKWETQFAGTLTFKWTQSWKFPLLTEKLGYVFFSIHILLRHTFMSRNFWKDSQLWNRNSAPSPPQDLKYIYYMWEISNHSNQ